MVSANQSELPADVKYVVMDENTLGYVIEGRRNIIGVLAGSVIRGGRNWLNGPAVVLPGYTRIRAATEADFDFYRTHVPYDFKWECGGCAADRHEAGQRVLDEYVWPEDIEVIGPREWNLISRQHLRRFVDVCYLGTGETSCDSDRLKIDFHVKFDSDGVVKEGFALDMGGRPIGSRGDVGCNIERVGEAKD
ncbi:hypothetical protein [Burkholderia stabilis]|uniref:hypothetical protein n=1 Tax=Burkholderia stabilis TaxID=95485 RepID=UPI001591C842|nr:hypothetical protein [Burkholderia stabilis]